MKAAARPSTGAGIACLVVALAAPDVARADEGGVPFWFSGQYASMSAVPPTPGWTATLMPYDYRGSADGRATFARGNTLVTDLDTRSSLLIGQASYAPDTKLFGAQPMIGLGWGVGSNTTSARISSELTSGVAPPETSDSVRGGTDLYPIAAPYWDSGITYNWRNPDTDYRNGIDSHLDWVASQFSCRRTGRSARGPLT